VVAGVSSLIAQSYSRYIGNTFQRFKHSFGIFKYMRSLALGSSDCKSAGHNAKILQEILLIESLLTPDILQIFFKSTGRWEEKDIINIYKYVAIKFTILPKQMVLTSQINTCI
jgi:hypothetical protein